MTARTPDVLTLRTDGRTWRVDARWHGRHGKRPAEFSATDSIITRINDCTATAYPFARGPSDRRATSRPTAAIVGSDEMCEREMIHMSGDVFEVFRAARRSTYAAPVEPRMHRPRSRGTRLYSETCRFLTITVFFFKNRMSFKHVNWRHFISYIL